MSCGCWGKFGFAVALPFCSGAALAGCAAITSASDYHLSPVDHATLRIGMPTVLQGSSAQLGIEMKRGVEAWFKVVNAKGGINARPIELDAVNDGYDPTIATTAIGQLLDIGKVTANDCSTVLTPPTCNTTQRDTLGPNHVLSILGQVGTPTMVVTAPVCIRNDVIYFGAFTGASRFLRDSQTISNVIFNYRASYAEETAAFVDYLFKTVSPPVIDYTHIIAFTQQDTYGDAGYKGFTDAYTVKVAPIQATTIHRANYTRGDTASTAVDGALSDTQTWVQPLVDQAVRSGSGPFSFGFFMIPTYLQAAQYIKGVRDWLNQDKDRARLVKPVFMNVSFVGADALAGQLKTLGSFKDINSGADVFYGDGVWVTQVVPSYSANLPGIVNYRQDLSGYDGQAPSWGSLEGYLAARLFTEGLSHSSAYDTSSMITAYESIRSFDLGIGPLVGFSNVLPEGHQASHTVWLSQLKFDTSGNFSFNIPLLWEGAPGTTSIVNTYQIQQP